MTETCRHTGKVRYGNKFACDQAITTQVTRLRQRRNHVPGLHSYSCRHCRGWHITSQGHQPQ